LAVNPHIRLHGRPPPAIDDFPGMNISDRK